MKINRNSQIKAFIDAMTEMRHFMHEQKHFFLKKMKFTPQQIEIMSLLVRHQHSVKEIAGFLNISSSAATQMIESLVKSKYVTRAVDQNDRRVVRMQLTDKGNQQLEEFKKIHFKYIQHAFSDLSDKEMQILVELPNKLIKQFKKLSNNL